MTLEQEGEATPIHAGAHPHDQAPGSPADLEGRGWSSLSVDCQPKIRALAALASLPGVESLASVSYASKGNALVIGGDERAVSTWLKLKRKSLDLTREALADRVGCSAATIRKLEAEERRPSEQIAERLAEVFEIPQNERKSFYRFARGDWTSPPGEPPDDSPWHRSPLATHTSLPGSLTSLVDGKWKSQKSVSIYKSLGLVSAP